MPHALSQMIGDADRGSAWTRAVLGLPAWEVHLCGDESALGLVERMARDMGEELQVIRYERSTPLVVEGRPKGAKDNQLVHVKV